MTDEFRVIRIVTGLLMENAYVAGWPSEGVGFVVDPGDEPDKILSRAQHANIEIKNIIATHAHMDHICAARQLQEATGAPFWVHRDDESFVTHLREQCQMWSYPLVDPPQIDGYLDGSEVVLCGRTFRVYHAPGHSPGHVCLHYENHLFGGDVLFQGSIGRYDLPGASGEELANTLREVILPLPDETIVHPGHGEETTIGRERRTNPFLIELAAGGQI